MVDSVLRNSAGHEIEFAFVDNGSSDGTAPYLRELQGRTRAHVITNSENRYVNPAWNQLMEYASGRDAEMIVLANNDILCGPGWLDAATREFKKDRDAGALRYFLPNSQFENPGSFENDVRITPPRQDTVLARAGWCFFFSPEAVRLAFPIPDGLRLWFGDDWIHTVLARNGYKCEAIMDCYCLHYVSVSVNEVGDRVAIIAEDRRRFTELTGLKLEEPCST